MLKPIVGGFAAPTHATERERKALFDTTRPSARQRGYDSKWEKARLEHLAEHPLCVDCEREGKTRAANVVDHEIPHKGDMQLFWDRSNWRSRCTAHHSAKTAREDSGFAPQGGRGQD